MGLIAIFFSDAPLDAILKTRVLCDTLNLAMIPLVLENNGNNYVAGDEENAMEVNDNDAISSISASSVSPSRSSSPSVSTSSKKGRPIFRKSNSIEKRRPYNPANRVKIYTNRLKLDKTRKGNFIRIFPRKDTFYLYKNMIEELDFRHEKQDMQLYKAIFEEDPDKFDIDTNEIHQELIDAKNFKTSKDLSSETLGFLQEALDEAAQYEAEKHANGYRIYPKSLPRIHPYARRRTSSQVTADEVRRQARLEALILQPIEQAILKSSSISNLLTEVKKAL
jgi:hypothetical protein